MDPPSTHWGQTARSGAEQKASWSLILPQVMKLPQSLSTNALAFCAAASASAARATAMEAGQDITGPMKVSFMNWPSLDVKDPSPFLISSMPQPDRLFASHSPLYMLHEGKGSLSQGPACQTLVQSSGVIILHQEILFIKEGAVFMLHDWIAWCAGFRGHTCHCAMYKPQSLASCH